MSSQSNVDVKALNSGEVDGHFLNAFKKLKLQGMPFSWVVGGFDVMIDIFSSRIVCVTYGYGE